MPGGRPRTSESICTRSSRRFAMGCVDAPLLVRVVLVILVLLPAAACRTEPQPGSIVAQGLSPRASAPTIPECPPPTRLDHGGDCVLDEDSALDETLRLASSTKLNCRHFR